MSVPLLAGVTVLDLSGVGPGARTARMLADFGATVLRVSPPVGAGGHRLSAPYYGYGASRDWRFLGVDLKSERGVEVIRRLAARSDIVIEGFRPGVADRLGVGYEQLSEVNGRLVYASISGFGSTGPNATRPGHDINYVSLAGNVTRDASGAPIVPPLTVADAAGGGMQAVISILAALHSATITGTGTWLDVSMTDGTFYLMSLPVDEHLALGATGPSTAMLAGEFACYGFYEAADSEWLAVGAIERGFFTNLCSVLGCPEWVPLQMRREAQDEMRSAFRSAFRSRTRAEWLEAFHDMDACVSPVNSIAAAADDPQFADIVVPVRDSEHGEFRQVGRALAGMVQEPIVRAGEPTISAAPEVLADLFDPDERQRLVADGIVS